MTKSPTSSRKSQRSKPEVQTPARGLWILVGDLRHGFRKNRADLSRRAALFVLLLLVLMWLLAGAYLVLVSQTMVKARHVQSLRETLTFLQEENAALGRLVTEKQSPERLTREAEDQGYDPAVRLEYVEP